MSQHRTCHRPILWSRCDEQGERRHERLLAEIGRCVKLHRRCVTRGPGVREPLAGGAGGGSRSDPSGPPAIADPRRRKGQTGSFPEDRLLKSLAT